MRSKFKRDPADGFTYTFAECSAFYEYHYPWQAIQDYWDYECIPEFPEKGKGKGKEKGLGKGEGKGQGKSQGKGKGNGKGKGKSKGKHKEKGKAKGKSKTTGKSIWVPK